MSGQTNEFYGNLIMAIAAFATGIFALIQFIKSVIFSNIIVKKWHETEGTITEYDVKETDDHDAWYKSIKYTYTVNGKLFTSESLSRNFYLASSSKNHIDKYYADYYPGQEVTVRYSPRNPSKAVIESKFDWMNTIWLIFGCGLLFFSYSIAYKILFV